MTKSQREIMEILEAFDLSRSAESAALLAGCDPKTVRHYVARREAGLDPTEHVRRARLIDEYLETDPSDAPTDQRRSQRWCTTRPRTSGPS